MCQRSVYVQSEAFMATECNEVFLGDHPCKYGLQSRVSETVPASIIRVPVTVPEMVDC
jgi:hypothetical protein